MGHEFLCAVGEGSVFEWIRSVTKGAVRGKQERGLGTNVSHIGLYVYLDTVQKALFGKIKKRDESVSFYIKCVFLCNG